MNIKQISFIPKAIIAAAAIGTGAYCASQAITEPKEKIEVTADSNKTNPINAPVTAGTMFTLGLFGRKKGEEDGGKLTNSIGEAESFDVGSYANTEINAENPYQVLTSISEYGTQKELVIYDPHHLHIKDTRVKSDGSKAVFETWDNSADAHFAIYDKDGSLTLEYERNYEGNGNAHEIKNYKDNDGNEILEMKETNSAYGPMFGKMLSYEKYSNGKLETKREYEYSDNGVVEKRTNSDGTVEEFNYDSEFDIDSDVKEPLSPYQKGNLGLFSEWDMFDRDWR